MGYLDLSGLSRFYVGLKERFLLQADVANDLTITEAGKALDARQGKALSDLCGEKAVTALYAAALPTAGWSADAPYTQTVSVEGILATDAPVVDVDLSEATTSTYADLVEAWNAVGRIATGAGHITAYCYEDKPTQALSLKIRVVK